MKMKSTKEVRIIEFFIALSFVFMAFIAGGIARSSISNSSSNLTIWDDSDNENRYSNMNITFYGNYTNLTASAINASSGNCTIRFNSTGSWSSSVNMTFNSVSSMWNYNRSFNYKGNNHTFEINCTSSISNLTTNDTFRILNTAPSISLDQGATYINLDGNGLNDDYYSCTEDTLCNYNFTANVTEIDANDVLTFNYSSTNITLTNFSLGGSVGILAINVTNNANTGEKQIELNVKDSESTTKSGILRVNISSVNDFPVFSNLQNTSFNISQLFGYIILATDEEDNSPFVFNITFINCSTAAWSTRNSTNCTLFNTSQYSTNNTAINISFTPVKNDVGDYIINFSVKDSLNATTSRLYNFSALNINSVPYFTYICDNERSATEKTGFSCRINATDVDETGNLSLTTNYSWFKFNNTLSSINITSSNYNISGVINFTPTNNEVGNWSVNLTISDSASPKATNSTAFWFYISNVNDSVSLNTIANVTAYTSNNYTIYANATDNDLQIPDKRVYRENLSFSSNVSWINISVYSVSDNITIAKLQFDPNSGSTGNNSVNLSVRDMNNFSQDSRVFVIQVVANNPPSWNSSLITNYTLNESSNFYFNLSGNVTDGDNDNLTFSFTNTSVFTAFSLNASTGIINFTPADVDVGAHIITINASDGIISVPRTFNFTIYNLNDLPFIEAINNMTAAEDNETIIDLWIYDEDFRIPGSQKSFYNESLTLNYTIPGNNNLFNFTQDSAYPTPTGTDANKTHYVANFTPRKADVGNYNITINVSDNSGNVSNIRLFSLTINAINHAPVLMNFTNQSSSVNRSFFYRINATDMEDGNSSLSVNANLSFNYSFLSGASFLNSTSFNTTTGIINLTFNDSHAGSYNMNISVQDSNGANSSGSFWLFVYGTPNINYPASTYLFNLTENNASSLVFRANHSVGNNLTYEFYLNGVLKYNLSYYGNETNLTWQFTPNFTDETYGIKNLTLIAYPPMYPDLNRSMNWSINISHANAPVNFSGHISDTQSTYNLQISINLSRYFSDIDNIDVRYNQTLNFTAISNSSPSYITRAFTGWNLNLSSLIAVTELITINASDLNDTNRSLTSITSNTFEVRFTTPSTVETATSGGGGGSSVKHYSLKIIFPGDVILTPAKTSIIVPVMLQNGGQVDFREINLSSFVSFNNLVSDDIKIALAETYVGKLDTGESRNLTMTITVVNMKFGRYKATIYANVNSPKFIDWGDIYVEIKNITSQEVLEKIVFIDELIAKNPECIEIKEIVDEAKRYYKLGQYALSLEKSREAIEACKKAIEQQARPREKETITNKIYSYFLILTIAAIVIGISYYSYKRIKLRRALAGF